MAMRFDFRAGTLLNDKFSKIYIIIVLNYKYLSFIRRFSSYFFEFALFDMLAFF
jgi:hypothetical protein